MFIETVSEEEATGDLAGYYQQQRAVWGYLPNFAGAFSSRPDVASAWNTLNLAIRDAMDRRRYEIATVAAARALRSTYCTAAHTMFLRDVCGDEASIAALGSDPSGGGLSEQDRLVYEFAGKVAADAASVEQSDIDRLRGSGLTDAEIADLVYAAAARAFFTRVVEGLGAQLDHQIADTFASEALATLVVGRPVADGATP